MKRIAMIVVASLALVGALAAQSGTTTTPPAAGTQAVVSKVEGKLALVNGMIAVQSGGKTYYVGGLQHLIGFIDGLKEGAAVKLEGYAQAIPAAPEYLHLRLTKLSFNGKDYDLSQAMGPGMGRGGMGRGGMGPGMGQGMMGSDGQDGRSNDGRGPGMGRGRG